MRSTFKVLFYLKKNNLKPDGKAPIMGRITVNGEVAQFSCKLNIKPSLWDTNANRAAGKSLEAQKVNQKLDNIAILFFPIINKFLPSNFLLEKELEMTYWISTKKRLANIFQKCLLTKILLMILLENSL